MNSRREFLTASAMATAGFALKASPATDQPPATEQPKGGPPATPKRDYWNDLPRWMTNKVYTARALRKAELAKITSPDAASARIAMVRERVWQLIGGKLENSPLNAKTTGVVERQDYRIEKIIFESQPEFYVTAHLYLPKSSGNGKVPAILGPLGHTPDGKLYPSYQTAFQNLARKGFAVLAWDPPGQGERLQYINSTTGKSFYGPTGEHDRFGWPALLIGSTTTQFEVWDGVRALDYLLTRPEIDPERIGCCGHSGGGTQTMYLCALEPRIKAAVVVEGNTENVAGVDYHAPGAFADAEQNIIGSLQVPIDRGDLLLAFAPKPLRICYSPIDNGMTYSPTYIRGTKEIYGELKEVYGQYGAVEKVSLASSPLPHDFDFFHRRSVYEWFNRFLMDGHGDTEETPFEESPERALWSTSTGQVLTSLGGREAYQVNADRWALKSGKTAISEDAIGTELRQVLNLPHAANPVRSISLAKATAPKVTIEEFEFVSEPGIRVPGWFLKPSAAAAPVPVVLMTDDSGRDSIFSRWSLVEKFTQAGFAICTIDLRTCGVTKPNFPAQGPHFYGYGVDLAYALVNLAIGSPIVGQQTWDLLRAVDYLETRADVDKKRIAVHGSGFTGLPSVASAALDSRIGGLFLHSTLADFGSVVESKEYKLPLSAVAFGLLQKFDVPDLCAALAPRPVWLLNTVGAQAQGLPVHATQAAYTVARQKYKQAGHTDNLQFHVAPGSGEDLQLEWARAVFA